MIATQRPIEFAALVKSAYLRRAKRAAATAREAYDKRTVLDQVNRRYVLAVLVLQRQCRRFRARLEDLVNRSVFAEGFDMTFHNGASAVRNNFRELVP
jgi:hypothetical protein